jgi:hypothetical protein
MNTTQYFRQNSLLLEREKYVGTDELGCLTKYLIFHLVLEDKGDNLSSYINSDRNGTMFHLERRFWGNAELPMVI